MKAKRFGLVLAIAGSLGLAQAAQSADEQYAEGGSKECLSCHDYSEDSPVHGLFQTPHGDAEKMGTSMSGASGRGCESCHGPSAAHANAPTSISPGISYGPKWSSSVEDQDQPCVACHLDNAAAHWKGGTHQEAELTCVTCHDAHQAKSPVADAAGQMKVCTTCHRAQETGMHGIERMTDSNPACSSCHQPHANPSPEVAMLANRSRGCSHCHNLAKMAQAPNASAKASSYHKVMSQRGRLCTDCHKSIAHSPADNSAASVGGAITGKNIVLFAPGQSDSQWLRQAHPGSQALRQGRDCEQCHEGDERNMGIALSEKGATVARDVEIAFSEVEKDLRVDVSWKGPSTDKQIALMWGNAGNLHFQRGGCWATCHSDMPGMSADRGQNLNKYLEASRSQQQSIGKPPQLHSAEELAQLRAQGNYVEIWRVLLEGVDSGTTQAGTVLDTLRWSDNSELTAKIRHQNGRWKVTFRRPLAGGPGGAKSFLRDTEYTFGVALRGDQQEAWEHWVSLPMTFSLNDTETDFIVRR